eukprot:6450793-Prymnesium_polylepis.1
MAHLAAHVLRRPTRWQRLGLHAHHLEHLGHDRLQLVGRHPLVDQRVVAEPHAVLVRAILLGLGGAFLTSR